MRGALPAATGDPRRRHRAAAAACHLDNRTADEVLAVLDALRAADRTIVLVTHAPDLAERADGVVRVVDDRIADDQPGTRSGPATPATA